MKTKTPLERFLELEALRRAMIFARARAEAEACLAGERGEDEGLYLFTEDAYFRH